MIDRKKLRSAIIGVLMFFSIAAVVEDDVILEQELDKDMFGLAVVINQANATVSVADNTKIHALRDVTIGATTENTNSVTLVATYSAAADPSSKASPFASKTATTPGTTTNTQTR